MLLRNSAVVAMVVAVLAILVQDVLGRRCQWIAEVKGGRLVKRKVCSAPLPAAPAPTKVQALIIWTAPVAAAAAATAEARQKVPLRTTAAPAKTTAMATSMMTELKVEEQKEEEKEEEQKEKKKEKVSVKSDFVPSRYVRMSMNRV